VKLAFALAVAVLFGTGVHQLLQRDLVRVVVGFVLISHSAVLTLLASGLTRGDAPIYPLPKSVSDPLPQAMALTALVIGLAVVALLLTLLLRIARAYRVYGMHELGETEAEREERLREEAAHARAAEREAS
jgi:multicomponent Na+:H+ antiporter subunit C